MWSHIFLFSILLRCRPSEFTAILMFEFWREATAASVPGFLCQSGHRRPENVSILSSLLAWWQRLLTHVSESLRTVSLIQATMSLPVVEWVNSYKPLFHLKESIASPFLIVTSWILIELQSSGPSQRTKPLLHSKLGDRICNIPFLSMLILSRF